MGYLESGGTSANPIDIWLALALDKNPPLGLNFSSRDAVSNENWRGGQSKRYSYYGRGLTGSDFTSEGHGIKWDALSLQQYSKHLPVQRRVISFQFFQMMVIFQSATLYP